MIEQLFTAPCKASDGELGAQQRGISNNNQQNQPVKLASSNQTRMFNNHMMMVIWKLYLLEAADL